MYAQRGNGKRSSFYSDFTFDCWDGDPDQGADLLPVGKAYFGFTDEELKWLDGYVRRHTINSFGPVRETDKSLVFEVAFDSVHESKRHKYGLAIRVPRINRIRTEIGRRSGRDRMCQIVKNWGAATSVKHKKVKI